MKSREGAERRRIRLQGLIVEELQSCLRDDVSDPALAGVRITAAVLSSDCRHCRVHATAPAARGDVEAALVRATPFLRARLADAIEVKRVPDLRFVYEEVAAADDVEPS
ncbi:MAG: ribosome-binding factor A [Deltaproteobacteria bacterium]|nr:ribosome-binding factor A [Deltaproteobacteria bacterium]